MNTHTHTKTHTHTHTHTHFLSVYFSTLSVTHGEQLCVCATQIYDPCCLFDRVDSVRMTSPAQVQSRSVIGQWAALLEAQVYFMRRWFCAAGSLLFRNN